MVENIDFKPGKVKPELSEDEKRARKNKLCWQYKRKLSNILVHSRDETKQKLGFALRSCYSWGEHKEYVKDGYRKTYTQSCKSLVCPICMHKKSSVRAANLHGVYKIINEDFLSKGLDEVEVFQFSLSPKNCEDLADGVEKVFALLDRVFGCHNRHGMYFSKSSEILGGVVSFECTRNRKNGFWHPHFHGLLFVQKQLAKADSWFEYNEFLSKSFENDEDIIFNNYWAFSLYEYIKKSGVPCFVYCAPVRDKQKGIYECVKYAIKPNCMDNDKSTGLKPSESLELLEVLQKLRKKTFRTYGKLRKIDIEDESLLDHGKEYVLYKFSFDQNGNYTEETDGELHTETDENKDKNLSVLNNLNSEKEPPLEIEDKYYFDAVSGEF